MRKKKCFGLQAVTWCMSILFVQVEDASVGSFCSLGMGFQAGVTLDLFPPTVLAVGTTGNFNFSGGASHTTKVSCLYPQHK